MPSASFSRMLPALMVLACGTRVIEEPPPPSAPRDIAPAAGQQWYHGAVFYEVFVRSFQDAGGDGRGDLRGLISRLDYLNDGNPDTDEDLGVDALWLMPVFTSPSYHGYDVTDYEFIAPDYGTLADFQRLTDEAHRRGMRVILDFVINHTSSQHPWFVNSAASADSSWRNWYQWREQDPGWRQPWDIYSQWPTWHSRNGAYYYGVFWGGMPDLNLAHPPVREEVKRLATLWLERGADGFRLDAVRYLIETGGGSGQADTSETIALLREFSAHVRSVKADAALVGEAWTSTANIARYYGDGTRVPGGDVLPLNFNFPLAEALLKAVQEGEAREVAVKLEEVARAYPRGFSDAPFLSNHDTPRVATQLGGDRARLGLAAALLLSLPGSPFLYYGEELGLPNSGATGDEAKRAPMPWEGTAKGGFTTGTPWQPLAAGNERLNVASQKFDSSSLLARYRKLIRARHESPALARGGLQLLTSPRESSPVLAFVRMLGEERVLVVHNLSANATGVGPMEAQGSSAEPLFVDPGVSLSGTGGRFSVSLPGRASGMWRLR